jgi:hypothetical protein
MGVCARVHISASGCAYPYPLALCVWVRACMYVGACIRTYTRKRTHVYACNAYCTHRRERARMGTRMGTGARSLNSVRDAQVRALCAWAGTGTGTRAEGYVFFL